MSGVNGCQVIYIPYILFGAFRLGQKVDSDEYYLYVHNERVFSDKEF